MCQIFSGQPPENYEPVTRRLRLHGHSTSIRLERSFWQILDRMAAREGVTTPAFVSRLHDEVLAIHGQAPNFASLLRCACLVEASRDAYEPVYAMAAE
ncbi:ribbon-helix-helix domain-containing protein [Rubellimicrobium roseum]|uniref:Ribbon-helix-helix domain-containing protein n=1 Tax=Rubellimicrobium roseum TaxID=687525 RepID=A0A5C4NA06_9RHOB|nr:ribbon-helix-helix domain-containing protein [Rubellimicrobium roseum]TNC71674.1 ribbon-helix-helix domain-containing protein [Rubellimicrobium roseum]